MARLTLLAVVVALVGAGCVAPSALDAASAELPLDARSLVAHTSAGAVALPAGWESLVVDVIKTPFATGEPTIGVTSDGTIFVTSGGANIARSSDNGKSWEQVNDPVFGPKTSLDPWIWVDPVTDRVFNAPLYVACTWMAYSDDKGDSWLANPIAGCGIPAHDHQKITTGPPPEGVTTAGYPNVIYYHYNGAFRGTPASDALDGTWVSVSLDGGTTFGLGTRIHDPDCKSGVVGGIGVTPKGTAISAKGTCEGVNIAISRDAGATWQQVASLNDEGIHADDRFRVSNPELTVDTEGNVFLFYTAGDGLGYLSVSTDDAQTWSKPVGITPPEVTHTIFSVAAAGEPGRVAFGYLGTASDTSKWKQNDPNDATPDTVWHLYMTFTENALDAEPTFVTERVTPENDPVQIGCIWLSGGGNACRNMLDFIDMVQHEGRAYLVYSDGCDKCTKADDSRSRDVVLAVVQTGPSLLTGVLSPLGDKIPDVQASRLAVPVALDTR